MAPRVRRDPGLSLQSAAAVGGGVSMVGLGKNPCAGQMRWTLLMQLSCRNLIAAAAVMSRPVQLLQASQFGTSIDLGILDIPLGRPGTN